MKKKVHIISHSHWDREWYLPYEQHHMHLIQLFDDLFEIIDTDPDFKSFHLDGQTISLDDYLQVKPENEAKLRKIVEEGKLKIGPFYILQDAFLTSSESNTRNALIGMQDVKRWNGQAPKVGYFPDTFGIYGQAPQMVKQFGFDVAAFGRGVKTTAFNNVVGHDDQFSSSFSEMWWEGADSSKVLGILFANWYSNGNEIPSEKEEAIKFWDQKLKDVELYASTRHLLMMNGCDHQPLQKDITKAIKLANELYPDYEFVHSDFETYMKDVQDEVPDTIGTIKGELTSQETAGWYTLANTASSRIYLKQLNTQVAKQLENIAEPLAAINYDLTGEYPFEQLNFAWKRYMQNHPHDSICGCSVDDVHEGMVPRFKDALEVGKFVANEAGTSLVNKIDTSMFPQDSKPFVVFNTTGSKKSGNVQIELEYKRIPFAKMGPPQAYFKLQEEEVPHFAVIDKDGKIVNAHIVDSQVRFGYDLPKDKFRQPYMARFVTVELNMQEMPEMSWQSFALVESNQVQTQTDLTGTNILENEYLVVEVATDGSLSIYNKETGRTYDDMLVFENVGDIGNEYIFFQPKDTGAILSTEFETKIKEVKANKVKSELLLETTMMIPVAAADTLLEEQMAVIEFRQRHSKRSDELAPLTIQTKVVLEAGSRQVKFTTNFNNQMKDHRLRVLFPTGTDTDNHVADSIYEVVERPNGVSKHWENPSNPQHQHAFASVYDNEHGVTVANFGLNEYEVQGTDNTIAVTIHRGTGELGDWGYFPTPEAQCIGEQTVEYAVAFHGDDEKSRLRTYHDAMNFQVPFSTWQTDVHSGSLATDNQYLSISGDAFALTALKAAEEGKGLVTRGYNLTDKEQTLSVKLGDKKAYLANLMEEKQADEVSDTLNPAEILTQVWS